SRGSLEGLRLRHMERGQRDGSCAHEIGAHRPRNVLDILLSHILERIGELVPDLISDGARDTNTARLRQRLQPRGYIDAVAIDVSVVDDDSAEIDPDPKDNAPVFGDPGIAVDHRTLQLDRAADGIDDAREFHQHAVAGGLDEAAAMLLELRVEELAAKSFEAIE